MAHDSLKWLPRKFLFLYENKGRHKSFEELDNEHESN